MKKRAQAGVFVIVGIVILAIVILVFYFKDSLSKSIREEPVNPQEYLSQQLTDIKEEVGRCVNLETAKASKLLMENGGSFERDFGYIPYFDKKYTILCREFEDGDGCLSQPILISNLGEKLDNYLPREINKCLNMEAFKNKDYKLTLGELKLNNEIFDDYILVNVDFPVELTKNSYSQKEDKFAYSLNIPLGALTKTANDLVQKKASGEEIDPLLYGLLSLNKYRIKVYKPYPDELYDVSLTTNDLYHFYFAIEGAGRYPRAGTIR